MDISPFRSTCSLQLEDDQNNVIIISIRNHFVSLTISFSIIILKETIKRKNNSGFTSITAKAVSLQQV